MQAMTAPQLGGEELGDYLRFTRRNLPLIVTCILLGLGIGIAYNVLTPPEYTSVSSIALAPLPTHIDADPESTGTDYVTIDTDGQLVLSRRVVHAVAESTSQEPSVVRSELAVTASPLSSVLHISVTTHDPRTAQIAAQTAARALLQTRKDLIVESERPQAARLELALADLERQLQGTFHGTIDTIQGQILNEQILTLRQRLNEARAGQRSVGEIIAAAELPLRPNNTNSTIPITSGALLGLLAGVALATFAEGLRRRR
jgi:uncharacterized protein involved in exopolysaccharide biosynthesis